MGALLMTLMLFITEGEAMLVRHYGKKQNESGIFFNAVICFFGAIFFIITDKNFLYFPAELLPYAIASCICYAGGFYFMYAALAEGSFIGSKMLSAFSVIIPVYYGILFLHEPSSLVTLPAIILMFLSVFMQIYEKSDQKTEKKMSKWFIYAFLSAICNGFITVLTRTQQLRFNGACDKKFMFFSFFGAFLFLLIISLIKDHGKIKRNLKYSVIYGVGTGALNGLKNFINLLIFLYFPISVATPVKLVLSYILSFMISAFIYKEPFTKLKIAGIITGVVSVVLFTI